MVMFYVKDKLSKAKDGYEVASLLKEKIGNEEGFFEFRMLKVEPYSKYFEWNEQKHKKYTTVNYVIKTYS